MEIGTKQDKIWRSYLVPESKAHGARFSMPMLLQLIKMYSKEGNALLDPMAGVFSLAVATTLGRDVYGIELEKRFADIAQLNISYLQSKYNTVNSAVIIQGDCRKILPLPIHIDCIITSPPYGTSVHPVDKYELKLAEIFGSTTQSGYGSHPNNIGNLSYQLQRFVLAQVYQKCYEQLKSGGRLIIITKDSVKDGKVQEQGLATMRSCIEAGFTLEAQHYRPCGITGRQALHIKHIANYRPILKEDILVFRKRE